MMIENVKLITPKSQLQFWQHLNPLNLFSQLFRYRELLSQFIWWEVNERYRGSALGILWTIIVPLMKLGIYTLVFAVLLGGKEALWGVVSNLDVGAMIFCGFLVFNVFAEPVGRSTWLMWSNKTYINTIVFPLEILPVIVVGATIVHSMIGTVILIILELLNHHVIHWTLIYLPIVFVPLIFFVMGLTWILATIGVFSRDVDNLIVSIIQMLTFLSSIFFPLSRLMSLFSEDWRWVVRVNLLSSVVDDARRIILEGRAPDWYWLKVDIVASLVLMMIGYAFFMNHKRQFADVV
jgi:lipopolysaccharide transport system permease protein